MKIAITGEGKTDFGQKEYSTGKWLPGPAIVYAEIIAKEKGVEVEFIPIEKEDVKKVKLQRRSSKEVSGRGIPARKSFSTIITWLPRSINLMFRECWKWSFRK